MFCLALLQRYLPIESEINSLSYWEKDRVQQVQSKPIKEFWTSK
jgi:hypothetical protein